MAPRSPCRGCGPRRGVRARRSREPVPGLLALGQTAWKVTPCMAARAVALEQGECKGNWAVLCHWLLAGKPGGLCPCEGWRGNTFEPSAEWGTKTGIGLLQPAEASEGTQWGLPPRRWSAEGGVGCLTGQSLRQWVCLPHFRKLVAVKRSCRSDRQAVKQNYLPFVCLISTGILSNQPQFLRFLITKF